MDGKQNCGLPSAATSEIKHMTSFSGASPPEKGFGGSTTDTHGGASANNGSVGGPSAEQGAIKHMSDYSGASPPEHSLGSHGDRSGGGGMSGGNGGGKISSGGDKGLPTDVSQQPMHLTDRNAQY